MTRPIVSTAPQASTWFAAREWSGAFGDLGTLIPFALAFIAIAKVPAAGVLFTFGTAMIAVAVFYRTPFPVQPMKAIGAIAATQVSAGTAFGPDAYAAAALLTGLFWLAIGASGLLERAVSLVSRPLLFGIVLGLGMAMMLEAVKLMASNGWIAVPALCGALLLLSKRRFPVMMLLLVVGFCLGVLDSPALLHDVVAAPLAFRHPVPRMPELDISMLGIVALMLVIPQLPLTFGNAVMAIVEENNRHFPQRKVSATRVAVSTGLMNIFSGMFGGVPMCHGAGGMAGHMRFGARTGGAPFILGVLLLLGALFAADNVAAALTLLAAPILGVVLFLAGSQLALGVCEGWDRKDDRFVLVVTAVLCLWNVGVAFAAGLLFQWLLKRKLLEL